MWMNILDGVLNGLSGNNTPDVPPLIFNIFFWDMIFSYNIFNYFHSTDLLYSQVYYTHKYSAY